MNLISHRSRIIRSVCHLLICLGGGVGFAAEVVTIPVGQRQLFLDDHIVEEVQRLKLSLHQPRKCGAVIRNSSPELTIQIRTAPIWDPAAETYKIWLIGSDRPLWTSQDGLHWQPGPTPNLYTDHVVYDPHDPDPGRRYKGVMTNEYFAVSPDGLDWKKLPVKPVQSLDESNLSYDPAEKLFIHTVKRTAKHGRAVVVAVSRDFEHWDDYGVVFQADDDDQRRGMETIRARAADIRFMPVFSLDEKKFRVDVYNMGVFHYEGQYIGLPAMFYSTGSIPNYPNTDGFHLVEMTVSRNLKVWTRIADRAPFIGQSYVNSGAYDLTEIMPPSAPVVRGDELWFYYTGLKYRSTFNYFGDYPNGRVELKTDIEPDHSAICVAVLRRDGFVSLAADAAEGFVLTKPFSLTGSTLFLNTQPQSGGQVVVEVLNETGQSLAISQPTTKGAVRSLVSWEDQDVLKPLVGKTIQLKLRLTNADLYAFEVGS